MRIFWIELVMTACFAGMAPAQWSAVLPGAAYSPGANNTQWVTDVRVYNPNTETEVFDFTFTQFGGVAAPVTKSRSVAAGDLVVFDNIILNEFGLSGVSGYLTFSCAKQLIVGQRTYNLTTEGTYGQYITSYKTDKTVYFTGMRGGDYRTNLGIVNGSQGSNTFVNDIPGLTISPNPFSTGFALQFNQIQTGSGFNPAGESGFVTGTSDFVGYTSVVDNRSGDPTYYPGMVALDSGTLSGLAHAVGANNTNWRTDLYLYAPTGAELQLIYVPFGQSGVGVSPQITVTLATCETKVYADFVALVAPGQNSGGTLFFEATNPVVVAGRTFNALEDKTYGQTILPSDWIPVGGTGVFLFAAKAASMDNGYRSNLCLINPNDVQLNATIELTGLGVGSSKAYSVPGRSALQINDIVGWMGESYLENGVISVTADAPFSGYLSHVDNVTGDGSTVTPGIVYSDQPPNIQVIAAPTTVTVGTTATYRFLVTDDGTRGSLQVRFYNPATETWTAWEDADPVYNQFTVYYTKVGTFTWKVEAFDQVNTVQVTGQTQVEDNPCTPPVITTADVSPKNVEVGQSSTVTYSFTGDLDSIEINWGDGTTNSNTSHTWTVAGDYQVKIRPYGCDAWGSWKTAGTVHVSEPCTPFAITGAGANPGSGGAPLTVTFTIDWSGTAPATLTINFGEGSPVTVNNINSSPKIFNHTYNNPGNYTTSVSGSNACGSDNTSIGVISVF